MSDDSILSKLEYKDRPKGKVALDIFSYILGNPNNKIDDVQGFTTAVQNYDKLYWTVYFLMCLRAVYFKTKFDRYKDSINVMCKSVEGAIEDLKEWVDLGRGVNPTNFYMDVIKPLFIDGIHEEFYEICSNESVLKMVVLDDDRDRIDILYRLLKKNPQAYAIYSALSGSNDTNIAKLLKYASWNMCASRGNDLEFIDGKNYYEALSIYLEADSGWGIDRDTKRAKFIDDFGLTPDIPEGMYNEKLALDVLAGKYGDRSAYIAALRPTIALSIISDAVPKNKAYEHIHKMYDTVRKEFETNLSDDCSSADTIAKYVSYPPMIGVFDGVVELRDVNVIKCVDWAVSDVNNAILLMQRQMELLNTTKLESGLISELYKLIRNNTKYKLLPNMDAGSSSSEPTPAMVSDDAGEEPSADGSSSSGPAASDEPSAQPLDLDLDSMYSNIDETEPLYKRIAELGETVEGAEELYVECAAELKEKKKELEEMDAAGERLQLAYDALKTRLAVTEKANIEISTLHNKKLKEYDELKADYGKLRKKKEEVESVKNTMAVTVEEQTKKIANLEFRFAEVTREKDEEIKELRNNLKAQTSTADEKAQALISSLQRDKDAAESTIKDLRSKLENANQEYEKIKRYMAAQVKQYGEKYRKCTEMEKTIIDLRDKCAQKDIEFEKFREDARTQYQELEKSYDKKAECTKELKDARSALDAVSKTLLDVQKRKKQIEQTVSDLQKELEKVRGSPELESKVESLQRQLEEEREVSEQLTIDLLKCEEGRDETSGVVAPALPSPKPSPSAPEPIPMPSPGTGPSISPLSSLSGVAGVNRIKARLLSALADYTNATQRMISNSGHILDRHLYKMTKVGSWNNVGRSMLAHTPLYFDWDYLESLDIVANSFVFDNLYGSLNYADMNQIKDVGCIIKPYEHASDMSRYVYIPQASGELVKAFKSVKADETIHPLVLYAHRNYLLAAKQAQPVSLKIGSDGFYRLENVKSKRSEVENAGAYVKRAIVGIIDARSELEKMSPGRVWTLKSILDLGLEKNQAAALFMLSKFIPMGGRFSEQIKRAIMEALYTLKFAFQS